ncbi:MAG: class I SAM-dependent methyltransferase [Thermoguttaceae bacterium]|nr:class I SAM-dependent methyltransferase [Thermoguttaceae bacterium]
MNDYIKVPEEFKIELTLEGLEINTTNSKEPSILKPSKEFDWDDFYRQGTPPWDTGLLEPDFKSVINSNIIPPHCSTLEIGCGSGIEALFMTQHRFEMTAVDCSAMAIDRARIRAREKNLFLRIVHEDIFKFVNQSKQKFDFVYDIGFYHFIRRSFLQQYFNLLWRVTKPGSYYYTLAGSNEEEFTPEDVRQYFLPTVGQEDIFNELGALFEVVEIRPGTIYSRARKEPFKAWSCLFRRP